MRFFVDGSIKTPTTEYLTNPKYQQVEYLESTGTQWIDTGIKSTDLTSFDMFFIPSENTQSYQVYLSSASNGTFTFAESASDITTVYLRYGGNKTLFATGLISSTTQNRAYINNDKEFIVNGTNCGSVTEDVLGTVDENVYIGHSSITVRDGKFKIYGLKLYTSVLVRDFIPVIRKEDGKPGIYDKVSGQFFTNAGTGEFLYGNPVYNGVPKGYKECEYLEGTGTQYIDTGFKPNPATTKIDCAFCALAGGSTQMFGVRTVAASNNANNTNICFGIAYSKIYIRGDWIRNHENLISDIEPEEYIHLIAHNQTMYINDVEYAYDLAKNNTYLDYNFCLFACNTAGSISFYNKIRQYYFKIYDNGILVRDYVPVLREANNESGMYDRVSNTFFANNGTGTFTYKLKERPTEKITRIAYSGSKMRLVRNTAA